MPFHTEAAFAAIGADLPLYAQRLMQFKSCSFWVHETKVSEHIGLKQSDEFGQYEMLTCLLAGIKKGHLGNERKKTKVFTGVDAVDLKDQNNTTCV